MAVQSKLLDFAVDDRSVAELAGINLEPSLGFDIFKKTFSNPNGQFRSTGVNADYFYNFTTGLELEVERPTLGTVAIEYPVNVELELPESVSAGSDFSVGTTDNYTVSNASITGESLNFGELGLNFTLASGGAGITDIEFGNFFGRSLVQLDDDLLFDSFSERSARLITINAAVPNSKIRTL